jgi:hypothetical protein
MVQFTYPLGFVVQYRLIQYGIGVATADDTADALSGEPGGVGEHGAYREGSRGFYAEAGGLSQEADGGADRVFGDLDDRGEAGA